MEKSHPLKITRPSLKLLYLKCLKWTLKPDSSDTIDFAQLECLINLHFERRMKGMTWIFYNSKLLQFIYLPSRPPEVIRAKATIHINFFKNWSYTTCKLVGTLLVTTE